MTRHLAEPLTRDRLARVACLSAAPFHAAFKQVLGKPPMQFLRDLRLRQAQRLLLAGPQAVVAEVAQQCGYPDPFVFSKVFRKHFGMSPSEYRWKVRPPVDREPETTPGT